MPKGITLTPKQMLFVEEYIKDFNGTHAAVAAGYGEAGAHVTATRTLKNPKVAAAVADAIQGRCNRVKIDADWVLQELVNLYKTDLSNFFNVENNGIPTFNFNLATAEQKSLIQHLKIEHVSDKDGNPVGVKIDMKLVDKLKALDLIAKHVDVQAFKGKIEHSGAVTLVIDSDDADS